MTCYASTHTTTACIIVLLVQLALSPAIAASVCTTDQIRTINVEIGTTVGVSACWMPGLIATPTAWGEQVCVHRADCVPVLESVVDELPDCAINGQFIVKDAVNEVIAYCEQVLGTGASSDGNANSSAGNVTDMSSSADDSTTINTPATTTASDINSDNNSETATNSSTSASASDVSDVTTSDSNSAGGSTALTVATAFAIAMKVAFTM